MVLSKFPDTYSRTMIYLRILLLFTTITTMTETLVSQYSKLASCANPEFDRKVNSYLEYTAPVISVTDAYNDRDKILFVDARGFGEYKVSHIPAARFVDYNKFDLDMLKDIPKNKRIVVYCSIGYRSEKIATKMIKAGFTNVSNLYGSIFEWANAGHDLYDLQGKPTKNIHTYNKKWGKWVNNPEYNKLW